MPMPDKIETVWVYDKNGNRIMSIDKDRPALTKTEDTEVTVTFNKDGTGTIEMTEKPDGD